MKAFLLLLLLALPLPLAAQVADFPSKEKDEEEKAGKARRKRVRLVFRKSPSLRFGKVLRMDFHLKFQGDFRNFDPQLKAKESEEELFDLHRTRVGVEGAFLKHFEFEVEREIREEVSRGNFDNPKWPWRDVYGNFRYFRSLQIKAGKFKLPFGHDQLTGPTKLDFIFRSRIGDYLTPGRDIGIMAHGRLFERGFNYQAGLFKQDGENAHGKVKDENGRERTYKTGQRTFVGRVTGTPLRLLPLPALLRSIEFGAAFAASAVPPGLKGLRGRTVAKETFFPHIDVQGHRLRLGTEMQWSPGPFSLKGEFIHVRDQRLGQALLGGDLPDMISRGWYLSGTWAVTGEQKAGGIQPRRDFLPGRGMGAVELATRYEQLRFGSAEHPGRPSRSPRATNILGNSERAWTFGVNWYWNRWVKIQANFIREQIEDIVRTPIPGQQTFWLRLVRVQFVM